MQTVIPREGEEGRLNERTRLVVVEQLKNGPLAVKRTDYITRPGSAAQQQPPGSLLRVA